MVMVHGGNSIRSIIRIFKVQTWSQVVEVIGIAKKVKSCIDIELYIKPDSDKLAILAHSEKGRKVQFTAKAVDACMERIIKEKWGEMVERGNKEIVRIGKGYRLQEIFAGYDCQTTKEQVRDKVRAKVSCDIELTPDCVGNTEKMYGDIEDLAFSGWIDKDENTIRLVSPWELVD